MQICATTEIAFESLTFVEHTNKKLQGGNAYAKFKEAGCQTADLSSEEETAAESEAETEVETEEVSEAETEESTEANPFASLDPSTGFTEEKLAEIDFFSKRLLLAADASLRKNG